MSGGASLNLRDCRAECYVNAVVMELYPRLIWLVRRLWRDNPVLDPEDLPHIAVLEGMRLLRERKKVQEPIYLILRARGKMRDALKHE